MRGCETHTQKKKKKWVEVEVIYHHFKLSRVNASVKCDLLFYSGLTFKTELSASENDDPSLNCQSNFLYSGNKSNSNAKLKVGEIN